jgi:hypothetical protein
MERRQPDLVMGKFDERPKTKDEGRLFAVTQPSSCVFHMLLNATPPNAAKTTTSQGGTFQNTSKP